MSKTNKPAFAQDPQTFGAVLTAAGAAAGTDAVELYTAGAEGCIITRLSITPLGTVTATGVVIYVQKAGSSVKVPRFSAAVAAYTLAATAKLPVQHLSEISEAAPARLGRGDKLFAATLVANSAGIAVAGEVSEFKDVGEAV